MPIANEISDTVSFKVIQPDGVADRFRQLADEWYRKAAHLSSPSARALIPEYQCIIGLGPPAVPLMLEELKKRPGLWFWALRAITGQNPVPESERGDNETMTKRWVDWGKAHGLC